MPNLGYRRRFDGLIVYAYLLKQPQFSNTINRNSSLLT